MSQVLFEKWWGRVVSALALAFSVWFVIVEGEGLLVLGEFLLDAVIAIPGSVATVIEYYGAVATGPLVASLMVGAVFGGVTTALVYLSARDVLKFPVPAGWSLVIALLVMIVLLWLGVDLLLTLAFGIIIALLVGIALQPEVRTFFTVGTLQTLSRGDSLRALALGGLIGGLAGALGAQILNYPLAHCTYESERAGIQQQLGVLITAVSASLVLIPVWTLAARRGRRLNAGTSGYFKGMALPLAFLAPTLISLLVFLYYPAVQVATLSLTRQRFRRTNPVCLDNYVDLATDTIYQNSFLITFAMMVAIVIFGMALALGIALLASQKVRGASIYRTLLIWPYALSPVVVGVIFLAMFRQGRTGLINYGLYELTGETLNWFTDPSLAPWVVIFASVYNVLGFNVLFYVAGLQNIPKDLLESAQIDGANVFQRFVRVTFPLLSPFTFFLLVTNVTYAFYGIYGAVDTLTQGGPPLGLAGQEGGATNVLIYKLYEDAFVSGAQLGSPAAQSIILFLLVAVITLLQFRYVENRVTYSS